jgi:tetratricopeptide (TPR) repeat protein
LVLAHGCEVTGHPDRAEPQYLAALAAKPEDVALLQAVASFYTRTHQGSKAEAYLQKILDPRTRASESQMAWARRQRAVGLAAQGGYPKIQEALALVERNLQAQSDSVADQRLKALLLGMQPGGQRDAIRAFEELARHSPLTPKEKFLLAQLYAASYDPAKAGELLLSALASQEENPLYLAFYIRNLLARGQLDEAQLWLGNLETLQPQNPKTVELNARLLAARGKGNEAAALVKAYTRDKDNLLGPCASLLVELGQPVAAEELYRDDIARSQRPEATLALAEFLAPRDRLPEALDLLDKAWQTCDPEKVGEASVDVLLSGKANDEQTQRVATRLGEATRKNPDSLPLLLHLANFRNYQGRYQDAETLYRRISEQDKSNDGPLNNLARLLAVFERKGAEALAVIGRAIARVGPRPQLLDTRALAYLAMGRSDLAIKDLEDAIAVRPTAESYLHLAQAYQMANQRNKAHKAWEEAKTRGLRMDNLHPLERGAYQRLVGELARR